MLAILLLVMLSVPGDILTVNGNGHAQFTTIQAAIDAAQPGDVILVAAGSYGQFVVDKQLVVLGPGSGPPPQVSGRSSVIGPGGCTLAGLDLAALNLSKVQDRVLVDDCSVGEWQGAGEPAALSVSLCDEVVLQRCHVLGAGDTVGTAVSVTDSRAVLISCKVAGAMPDLPGGCGYTGAKGGRGLDVTHSEVTLATCKIAGGQGGAGCGLPAVDGDGGDGLVAQDSTVIVRGRPMDFVEGGYGDPFYFAQPGMDLVVEASTVVISGVAWDPDEVLVDSGGQIVAPPVFEPFLDINLATSPGQIIEAKLYGPLLDVCLLFGSLEADLQSYAKLESPLWLAANHSLFVYTVTTFGVTSPVDLQVLMPVEPGFEGLTLHVQAVFPGDASAYVPGTMVVTNPVSLVQRF